MRARIIKIDWAEKKIGLTMREVDQPAGGDEGSSETPAAGPSDEHPAAEQSAGNDTEGAPETSPSDEPGEPQQ